jgi:hypothetical protein
MTTATQKDWKKDFGIDRRQPPSLFTSKDEITPLTPQAHLLRRAFDVLTAFFASTIRRLHTSSLSGG